MQKIKARSYQTIKYATIIGAGTMFGSLAGFVSFVFGGLSYGLPGAHLAGGAAVLLASAVSTAIASMPFERL